MKSIRTRLVVTFIGLMVAMIAVVWGVNQWYLEQYYISEKVKALNEAYETIDGQIRQNLEQGISIQEAMGRTMDSDGNIEEGDLLEIVRDFSDSANVSMLMIDNSLEDPAIYSTARDVSFLKDRIDRYILGKNKLKYSVVEKNDNYTIQKTFDPLRDSLYLESWGFFSDYSTAFIMSTPLSSIGESVALSNRFLTYVGFVTIVAGAGIVYLMTRMITKPISRLSELSERMSGLDFDAKYEAKRHDSSEITVLGNSMNELSERLNCIDTFAIIYDSLCISINFNVYVVNCCSIFSNISCVISNICSVVFYFTVDISNLFLNIVNNCRGLTYLTF